MSDYTEHLISMAGGDGEVRKGGMAEVILRTSVLDLQDSLALAKELAAAGFGDTTEAKAHAHKVKRIRGELKSLGKHLDSWESEGHTTATIRFLRFWIADRSDELGKS